MGNKSFKLSYKSILVAIRLLFVMITISSGLSAQPIDLMIPHKTSPDSLTKELRSLNALERDLSIEKLTKEKSKLDAFLELGELRFSQGRLLEAQRFFEMAEKIDPNNLRANQGLTMVHYEKGEFNEARSTIENIDKNHTIADELKYKLKNIRSEVCKKAQFGLQIRENNKGLQHIITSAEAFIPSFTYRKIHSRYRFENHDYSDGPQSVNSRVYSGTLDYKMDDKNSLSITFSPESFSSNESVSGYSYQAISGTDNLHIAVGGSKETFRDNIFTIRNHMSLKDYRLTLYGSLNKRTRVVQTISTSDVSDGNSLQRYDSNILYYIFRRGAPFLSLNLGLSQFGFDKQTTPAGSPLNYWSPSNFKGSELTMSWERSVGVHWWWGIDASLISNSYKISDSDTFFEKGSGLQLHASYKFTKGRIFAAFSDRINDYLRERRLDVFSSIFF